MLETYLPRFGASCRDSEQWHPIIHMNRTRAPKVINGKRQMGQGKDQNTLSVPGLAPFFLQGTKLVYVFQSEFSPTASDVLGRRPSRY